MKFNLNLKENTFKSLKEIVEGKRIYLPDASISFALSFAVYELKKNVIFIPSSNSVAEDYYYELSTFLPDENVFEFPDFEALPHEKTRIVSGSQAKRLRFLKAVTGEHEGNFIGVLHPTALLRKFPQLDEYRPFLLMLKTGEDFDFEELIQILVRFGYERSEICEVPGTYAVRGGLIDVFPPDTEYPFRIDFFGDTIESIRRYDPESQLSTQEVQEAQIGWNTDTPVDWDVLGEKLDSEILENLNEYKSEKYSLTGFWPYMFKNLSSLIEILDGKDYLIVYENTEKLEKQLGVFYEEMKSAVEGGFSPSSDVRDYFEDPEDVLSLLYQKDFIELQKFKASKSAGIVSIEKRALKDRLLLNEYISCSREIFVVYGQDLNPEKIRKSLDRFVGDRIIKIQMLPGYLRNGFFLEEEKVLFLPAFFFTGSHVMLSRKRPAKIRTAETLDLLPGDYVVHPRYGVGRYKGISRELRDEVIKELILIEYQDGEVKVPLEYADKLTRYLGDLEKVQIDKISSREWLKARQKAQKSARKLAFDLLKVYAKRLTVKRKPYDLTNPWIMEFESLFPYDETADQAAAINDVYQDMASETPMERLIIGDVGYGKTEVAMRASFVAVVNFKQVIVLAPTTVLAEQHYQTWKERFQHFPVEIEFISRFQKPTKRKEIIERFNQGLIDILIGTHAVLSKNINLQNVGLAIIDEEHRFGVNQKEIFKARKSDIDILMLSATPIPRTLQMALSGLRPLSFIETPPPGRLPVITYIGNYDEKMVIDALRRELEREGQALYVCNKIEALPGIANHLSNSLPGARVAFAHGQMPERDLERIMLAFWEGKYDILVSTTIIESGLDMPNVNTIVVESAEKLGLAQAYQLKGRVGRSYRQAYAYFLTKKPLLTEKEEKRMKALIELTGWGSGYRLALKDLEIRGAGNILGPEQHGHMNRVGISYFIELLKHEIEILKSGGEERKAVETTIEIPVDIYIPESYIDSLKIRYEIYRRAAALHTEDEMKQLYEELFDRFGEPPQTVRNLLLYGLVRNLARDAGAIYIKYAGERLVIRFSYPAAEIARKVRELRKADVSLNAVSVRVQKKEILHFLNSLLPVIISKINS